MRRIILLLFSLVVSLSGFSQLEVKEGSFHKVEGFVNINTEKMFDDNDKPYAVLKIKTENIGSKERRELNFGGDARTFFEAEYKDGEVWLYISYYASFIKISHEELSSTEFYFPFDMEPKCGYELTLVNKANTVVSGWAALTVTTKPENGAKVLLNGRDVNAITPYSNNMIPSGKYEITVSKDKFVTTTKTVEIKDSENKDVEIEMQYAYGNIRVVTIPTGATVFIDNINYGITPLDLDNIIVVGTHELRLEQSECATLTKTITLDDSNTLDINEKLQTGREISIITDQNGDKIFVDGSYIGESPLAPTLTYGEHYVKATRGETYREKTITVPKNDDEITVKFTLFEYKTFEVNGVSFDMVYVNGGTFILGCVSARGDCNTYNQGVCRVRLSDYYIGKFEVTQKLWEAVMGTNPSFFKGEDLPVENVSWYDAQEFIEKLNILTGEKFRLPTEAEWEYAARGGNKTKYYQYSGSNNAREVSHYSRKTYPVGTTLANELGIYDMSGNVWEWCQDRFQNYYDGSSYDEYTSDETLSDPIGPSSGSTRVVRGGDFDDSANNMRVTYHIHDNPDLRSNTHGFRLVLGT